MGGYIGTLLLMVKQNVPRIIGVFAVITFSFGGGLYFALVGHYNDGHVDMVNDNSTRFVLYKLCIILYSIQECAHCVPIPCSEIYLVWLTGARMIIEGSILTYYGSEGFK